MYELAKKLFPICRSITGNGVRETLKILKEEFSEMNIFERFLIGKFPKSGI